MPEPKPCTSDSGFACALFNQERDPTKPTWVLGLDDEAPMYERLGFRVRGERTSALANAQGTVPNHRRMVLELRPRAAAR